MFINFKDIDIVSDSGAIWSAELDAIYKRALSKMDLLQIHSAVTWGAMAETCRSAPGRETLTDYNGSD